VFQCFIDLFIGYWGILIKVFGVLDILIVPPKNFQQIN